MTTSPAKHNLIIEVDNNWDRVAERVVKQMKALTESKSWEFELVEDGKHSFDAMRIKAHNYQKWENFRYIVKPMVEISVPKEWGSHKHIYAYETNESLDGFILIKQSSIVDEDDDSDCPTPLEQLHQKRFTGTLRTEGSNFKEEAAIGVRVLFEVTVHIPPFFQKEEPLVDCCGWDDKDKDPLTLEQMDPSGPPSSTVDSPTYHVHRYGPGEWDRICYSENFLKDFIKRGRSTKDPHPSGKDINDPMHTWSWEGHEKPNKTTCKKRVDRQDKGEAPLRESRPVSVRYRSLLS